MILLIDSGGTKTQWALLVGKKTLKEGVGIALHPDFTSTQTLQEFFNELNLSIDSTHVKQVYFYGAGMSNAESIERYKAILKTIYSIAQIYIAHDILASARAMCVNKEGVACILGTGTNSCIYDGENIIENRLSLGYLLGDEGSGTYFGKQFLKAYLENALDEDFANLFEQYSKRDKKAWVVAVNTSANVKGELSSVMPFIKEQETNPFIDTMLTSGFDAFVHYHLEVYPSAKNYPVNFTGSVAYYFQEQLKKVVEAKGYQFGKVVSKPMEGLINYHLSQ